MNLKKITDQIKSWDISRLEFPNIDLSGLKLPGIKMPPLKIDDLSSRLPVVQGGMGVGISLSGLASAVAKEGGIGVIAANAIGMIEPDYFKNGIEANKRALRKEIRKAKSASNNGIIGVNIMMALNDFREMIEVSVEEKADILFLGAGLPLKGIPIEKIRENGIKVIPIVSSSRAARLIFSYWKKNYNTIPDGVVVEGPLAGGHLGFKPEQIDDPDFVLEKLVSEVVESLKEFSPGKGKTIPVIAAGGIFNGEDIHRFLKLGASGVQMGTRFVATQECDADENFKLSYVNATKEDIVIIKSPVGLPGRAIKNKFVEDVSGGSKKTFKCPWKCLESCNADKANYCISIALNNARKGKMSHGYAFAGANAYRVDSIMTVKELLMELSAGFSQAVESRAGKIKNDFERILEKLSGIKEEYEKIIEQTMSQYKEDYRNALQKRTDIINEEIMKHRSKLIEMKKEFLDGIGNLSVLYREFLSEMS